MFVLQTAILGFIIGYIIRLKMYKKNKSKPVKTLIIVVIILPLSFVFWILFFGLFDNITQAQVGSGFVMLGAGFALKLKNPNIIESRYLLWILLAVLVFSVFLELIYAFSVPNNFLP